MAKPSDRPIRIWGLKPYARAARADAMNATDRGITIRRPSKRINTGQTM